ncbi:NAD(P)H-quinone oxidoreductase [Acuticoccus mangrovi]|uniref:NAD(P)H-quinone oxidoreductase n=1 Tax=Acuticoccus mangrovi TaxID=2796142 RepID=A0A934IL34_9HYPH|nr:NAD(P)H-quinone oxidoreductase [Acuticoccus mangrovi]MBJ3774321.1 NAD(P)H-quinone oxidoreductase [Acuticoccus mangrovi]
MTIETMMRAVTAPVPGGPDVLAIDDHPTPAPGPTELLVKVAAAGVNRPDCIQRSGNYPPPPGVTPILGLEFAGTVVAVGRAATRYKVGDEVTALVPGGGYAEYCAVDEANALPVPKGLSLAEAAALPETYFTVWTNVFDRGKLKAGEWFMVHGGTSGIGTTAIQLAKLFGAKVIATAGSPEKCAACEALGADRAVNYNAEDFVSVAKEVTGSGVNLTLDMVGGDYVERNWKAAAVEGRIVQIATLNGPSEANFSYVMQKRLVHTGSTLRARDVAFKAEIAAALKEHVWPLIEAGKVKPVMDRSFALADAAEAHRRMESSKHIGKIVLTV